LCPLHHHERVLLLLLLYSHSSTRNARRTNPLLALLLLAHKKRVLLLLLLLLLLDVCRGHERAIVVTPLSEPHVAKPGHISPIHSHLLLLLLMMMIMCLVVRSGVCFLGEPAFSSSPACPHRPSSLSKVPFPHKLLLCRKQAIADF
jgi:hypothetical protein